jgi:hypothetical protein
MTPAPIASAQGIGLQQLLEMMDWGRGSLILVDKAEYVLAAEGRPIELDAVGWYGGDYDRLWFRAEGEQLTADLADEGNCMPTTCASSRRTGMRLRGFALTAGGGNKAERVLTSPWASSIWLLCVSSLRRPYF